MGAQEIISMVQNLGVAVVMCLMCAWFIKYMFDKFMEKSQTDDERHKQEMDSITEALNNNTQALTKLSERLEYENRN